MVAFGARLGRDDALRARLDGWAADLAVFVVERYGSELTGVITQTIDRWDGREAARKIELTWAVTCSSSASTAPSSVAWSGS